MRNIRKEFRRAGIERGVESWGITAFYAPVLFSRNLKAGHAAEKVCEQMCSDQKKSARYILRFRLLLWDCDDRYYSYYVEVSVNQIDWIKVIDRRINQC
ncbi:hypothetical protein TELCIR_25080, partial [Teladorsagia circumcincta]